MKMVNGEEFISREEFNKIKSDPDAPQDYSYDQYVEDSGVPEEEWNKSRIEYLEAANEKLEQRLEILFGAHALIEIGMRAVIEISDRLRKENEVLRAMLGTNPDEVH